MPAVIDTSLWIDFTRQRSSRMLKQLIAPYVLSPEAALAEPIVFEILRHATPAEVPVLEAQFHTLPMLSTPPDLWTRAATLGQRCRQRGVTAGSIDLLIVAVVIFHDAELITFDRDFVSIAKACAVQVKLLHRPQS